MTSSKLTSITAIVLFVLLAISVRLTAQEQRASRTNPVPLINQPLVPDSVVPGGKGFKLTVNGTGFVSVSVVNWNGNPLATTFVSGSQLTASVPASDIAKANTAFVTVDSPSPGGTSNVAFFEVTIPSSSISLSTSGFGDQGQPDSVAVGDFNRDGKLDLAVANSDGYVSVLLGNGDGTFQAGVNYDAGAAPDSVAVGDFNGDGTTDLAVASGAGTPSVSVLLGNGDGTFQVAVGYSAGSSSASIAVGDFNGDGKLDLAVANYYSNDVSILLGNGDGTFQTAVNYGAGSFPDSVAVGDFNRDGKLDLAVANGASSNSVSVLLGNGDGTFQPAVKYGAPGVPISVAVGDFNGDGRLDLAVANLNSNNVSILLGNGDGTFKAAVSYGAGSEPFSVVVGDFNGDGKLDLAAAIFGTNEVSILLGNGDGTFKAGVSYGAGESPYSLAVGDFNGDGRLDLAVADRYSFTSSVLLQAPTVSLSKTALTFADRVVGSRSAAKTVRLTNTGYLALDIASLSITGANATDFRQTNACGSSLPAGASCTISVTFKPTQVGPRTASVTITDNAVGSPQLVALSGTGESAVSLSKTALTFADRVVGSRSAAQSVTLTNIGAQLLSISSIAVTGTNETDFRQTNTCGSSLPAGASCTISVTFKPTQVGPRTASVTITDNAVGSPQSVALGGTGLSSGPNATLSPTSVTFSTQLVGTSSSGQAVTLINYGEMTLSISSIIASGDFSQSHTCGSSLEPLASCTISVTFKPTRSGTRTGTLSITDNGGGSPQKVSLSGTGTVVELAPTNLSFNCGGPPLMCRCSPPQTTTLTNTGSTTLSVSSIKISGREFSQTNTCGTSLKAEESCTIKVTFGARYGKYGGAVVVSDNGGGSPQMVALTGSSSCR
jgi:hypothetical protein